MENDIALIAIGYVVSRIAFLLGIGYFMYRVLNRKPARARIQSQSNYANERKLSTSFDR